MVCTHHKVMDKEEINKKIEKERAERKARIVELWNNLKPFVNAEDVPNLPTAEAKEWNGFYVPKLIKAGAIPKEKLADGIWYYGEYRNANFGKWDAIKQEFGIWRYKFGWRWDTCKHFQDDDGYALFVPIRAANEDEVKIQEGHETLNKEI
jgi:hypothetical protein